MINKKTTSFLLFLVFMFPGLAMADFSYQDKPITPACLAKFVYPGNTKTTSVKLNTCSRSRAYKLENDVIASSKKPFDSERSKLYTQYSIIGQNQGRYLINLQQWTGGSGIFSYVLWVEKSNDELKLLKVVASGDRCNGGTTRTGEWMFSVNLISFALLEMADKKPKLAPYKDLDDSASGCIAKSYYRFDPNTENAQFAFTLLDREKIASDSWDKKVKYQACFNELAIYFIDRGQIRLNQAEINLFSKKFNNECVQ